MNEIPPALMAQLQMAILAAVAEADIDLEGNSTVVAVSPLFGRVEIPLGDG